jgi:hypothetical protein
MLDAMNRVSTLPPPYFVLNVFRFSAKKKELPIAPKQQEALFSSRLLAE